MKNIGISFNFEDSYSHGKRLNFIKEVIGEYCKQEKLSKNEVKILDIGCGTGVGITFPIASLGYSIVGIDPDEDSIKWAKEKNIYSNVDFIAGYLEELPNLSNFDIIICSEVLEHVPNPKEFLLLLKSRLKKGGILIITVPNGYGWFELEKFLYENLSLKYPLFLFSKIIEFFISKKNLPLATLNKGDRHIQRFSFKKIRKLFKEANFDIMTMKKGGIFGGPISETLFWWFKPWLKINNLLGDLLCPFLSLDWYFVLKRASLDKQTDDNYKYKQNAINQWTKNPIGTDISRSPEGTIDFFEEIRKDRYENYAPWLLKTFNFHQYKEKKVLEIGVGSGIDHLEMARMGAFLTGIDITPKSIELTKKNLELHGYTSNLLVADAENLPFPDNCFDVVYSFGVLHHTPNTQKAIDEIYRVLNAQGKAIISLYNKNSLFFWFFVWFYDYILHGKFLKMTLADRLLAIEYGGEASKPLVKLYTRKQVRNLFKKYKKVKIYTRHAGLPLFKHRLISKFFSLKIIKNFFEFLADHGLGWYLIIEAEK